jgi:hypothetical protein
LAPPRLTRAPFPGSPLQTPRAPSRASTRITPELPPTEHNGPAPPTRWSAPPPPCPAPALPSVHPAPGPKPEPGKGLLRPPWSICTARRFFQKFILGKIDPPGIDSPQKFLYARIRPSNRAFRGRFRGLSDAFLHYALTSPLPVALLVVSGRPIPCAWICSNPSKADNESGPRFP